MKMKIEYLINFSGLQVTTLSLTIWVLAVVASQVCEIPQNSAKIRTYSISRTSKVIDLGANQRPMCNFLLVINNNFGRIPDIDV